MASENNQQPAGQNPPPPPQRCPRCDSSNTKFCYYNNYSLSQPRYFCKSCRRYWTQGGTLRSVPVGGGSRKSRRPRSAAVFGAEAARVQQPVLPGQHLAGMISGQVQSLQVSPAVLPPMGGTIFAGGELLSSLSLPTVIGQRAGVNLSRGGASGRFGANMALLQGFSFQALKAQVPPHFQPQNENFALQQSLISARPSTSWTQTFINRGASSSSAGIPLTFWTGTTSIDGGNQAGSSNHPNQWSDPGFGPPQ